MVFYYSIRGGQCLNDHSHITLTSDDIICYVGRDKHENEYLIKYGWPGDIWFHVDGLSSAHVYFRLKNTETVSSIPMDDLPPDSVYDMMQICKHNSISGSKLASCKMVWTPHSNLKKTFEMESGAVTYHDTKLCRYARCDKDRPRIKELEKTKTDDVQVDYYQEMKDNERRIIERKKRNKKAAQEDALYDPIQEDINMSAIKATRQGDQSSGLDVGLAALENLSFAPAAVTSSRATNTDASDEQNDDSGPDDPLWVQEMNSRQLETSDEIRFLRERGYTASEAKAAYGATKSRVGALRKLYLGEAAGDTASVADVPEEVVQTRLEEKEVLLAMYGEDEEAVFSDKDNEAALDVAIPITTYEAPERYDGPPPLMLEIFVDNNIAPLYPNEPPVLALVGGGLPEARLRELTNRLRKEAQERIQEEPGDPQIFNLMTFAGEEVENIIREETADIEAALRARMEAQKKALALQRAAETEEQKKEAATAPGGAFATEAERRAYAMDVAAKGGTFAKVVEDDGNTPAPAKGKKFYNTGVSDQDLINDLFG